MASKTAEKGVKNQIAHAVQTAEIATTSGGRDITRPYINGLQQPRDPRLLHSVDWGIYDRIFEDDQVFATLQQRKRAVIGYNWHIAPGDDDDPRSVAAAQRFDRVIQKLGWDRVTEKMLHGLFTGFAVAEMRWQPSNDGWDFSAIKVRHARRFRFDAEQRLHLLTLNNVISGELLPDYHFWTFSTGSTDDDEPYGLGLANWLYWPCLFKRNGIRFWNLFIEKYAAPTAIGTYRRGTPPSERDNLLEALGAIQTESGIVIPEGATIALLEAAKSGIQDYETLVRYMDEAIAKIILSQTMTTQNGSSLSQAQVHAGVKMEVVKADADLLSESFNDGPARWWCALNYGDDVAPPRLVREVDEEADLAAQAETDSKLHAMGWVRDEESFKEIYGAGFIRKEANVPAKTPATQQDMLSPAEQAAADKAAEASFAAEDLRPLYVYRALQNADDVLEWARAQGFTSLLAASDLHVTIAYSRAPVNWLRMGDYFGSNGDGGGHYVPAGGPRLVEKIGEQGAIALFFYSSHLDERNKQMRARGASWDYDQYHCHITLSYGGNHPDLQAIEPYRGELRFGPEIFEPLQLDWQSSIRQTSFAEALPAATLSDQKAEDSLVRQLMASTPHWGDQQLAELSQLEGEAAFYDWLSGQWQKLNVSDWSDTMAKAGQIADTHGLMTRESDDG